jgi:hypothetical protein
MPDSFLNPIELGLAVAAVLLVGFVMIEGMAAPGPALEPPGEAVASKPHSHRGRVAIAGGIVLLVLALGGCVFVNTYEPLRAEGPAVGSGPLYLGTVPATFGGVDNVEFAAVSGGEMRMEFSLANTGDWPVTVVGLDPVNGGSSWDGTIFHSGSLIPVGQVWDGSSGRFDIPAHASARGNASLVFGCIGLTPTPTLAPGKSPSAQVAMAAEGYTRSWIDSLPIEVQFLGLQHRSIVKLPASIAYVAIDMSGCGGSENPYALPSGLYVTQVPSITYP